MWGSHGFGGRMRCDSWRRHLPFAAGACGPVGGVGGDSCGSVRPDSAGAGIGFSQRGWGVVWVGGVTGAGDLLGSRCIGRVLQERLRRRRAFSAESSSIQDISSCHVCALIFQYSTGWRASIPQEFIKPPLTREHFCAVMVLSFLLPSIDFSK